MIDRSHRLRAILARIILILGLAGLLALPWGGLAAAPPATDLSIPSGHFYTQANGQGGAGDTGYAIVDDAVAPFWSEFQRLGMVDELGYPASRRFVWDGFVSQVMQKQVFQWRPDLGGTTAFVNVFDELSKAGKDTWLQAFRQVPPPFDTSPDRGLTWNQIVNRHLAYLDADPTIRDRFLATPNWMDRYGLPVSYADYGNVFVVRAQRAVLQHWKVNVPWAMAGDVTVANGGDVAKEAGLIPSPALAVQTMSEVLGGAVPTPTAAPPLVCAQLPVRGFGQVWFSQPQASQYVGCPSSPGGEAAAAFQAQRFEGGVLFWTARHDSWNEARVFALFGDDHTFARIVDRWITTTVDPPPLTPPAGRYEPRRRLGLAWREGAGVRTRLGWAVEPESSGQGATQAFQRGSMYWFPYGLNPGPTSTDRWIYVLANTQGPPSYAARADWLAFQDTWLDVGGP